MGKTRMSVLDLQVQSHALHDRLRGALVVNVYDINSKTYLIKLAVPPRRTDHAASLLKDPLEQTEITDLKDFNNTNVDDDDDEDELNDKSKESQDLAKVSSSSSNTQAWQKVLLIIESGARIHTTNFARDKNMIPSGFAVKIRKHIRTKRLESITQVGTDRLLDLAFAAAGQVVAHLILEFYAAGNIILTDANYQILALLRQYKLEDRNVAVKEVYPIRATRQSKSYQVEDIKSIIQAGDPKAQARKYLMPQFEYGPQLFEHALCIAGFSSSVTMDQIQAQLESTAQSLFETFQTVNKLLQGEAVPEMPLRGYLFQLQEKKAPSKPEAKVKYDDFSPFLLAQFKAESKSFKEFHSFDDAVDEYFADLESRLEEESLAKKEEAVMKKVDKLKNELDGRLADLQKQQELNERKARLIEQNLEEVDAVLLLMRQAIASGMDWEGIGNTIRNLKKSGNPVIQIIHSLQLQENEITLMLCDNSQANDEDDEDEDEDDEDQGAGSSKKPSPSSHQIASQSVPSELVRIDLSLSAFANASRYYVSRKTAASKEGRAIQASESALGAAERKARQELSRVAGQASSVREIRKPYWFEKFHWFISSENYLVLAGRDAQQNEILVRRYMEQDDVYVHADIHGAATVIVKNRRLDGKFLPISPLTLSQAGTFAMCRSSAWNAKIVTSAWWVYANQVSKTAPTGEYLSTGSFMIRGKKNFLPPTQLVMGFGVLFRIDESCLANHLHEREVKGRNPEDDAGATEQQNPSRDKYFGNDEDVYTIIQSEDATAAGSRLSDRKAAGKDGDHGKKEKSDAAASVDDDNDDVDDDDDDGGESNEETKDDGVGGSSDAIQEKVEPQHEELEETDESQQPTGEQESSRKYMSAKARRDSKKGSSVGGAGPEKHEPQPSQPKTSGTAPVARGKRNKLKKIKDKYGEQSDEERELALRLLGATKIKEEQEPETKKAGAKRPEPHPKDGDGAGAKPDVHDKPKAVARKERKQEAKQVKQILEEEGITEISAAEKEALSSLDLFTAIPLETDIIQFAMAVCAPYSAMQTYRYKVKLLPGALKRGKAYKQAHSVFVHSADKGQLAKSMLEKDCIRKMNENDGMMSIMSEVRVQAPGLQEAQQGSKSNKKKAAKQAKDSNE